MSAIKTEVPVEPIIQKLVAGFCESRKKDLAQLQQLLSNGRFPEAMRICHTIKGVAVPYGFPTLGRICNEIEESLRNGFVGEAQKQFESLKAYAAEYCDINWSAES